MGKVVRFSVSIDADLIDAFDSLSREMGYANRSEVIRDAIRHRMVQREWEAGDEVAGVIALLYDHHRPGLAETLMEIQHHALTEVISTTHVHVDATNCLELIAVQGASHAIEHLANRMISLKGVKHGALTDTSTVLVAVLLVLLMFGKEFLALLLHRKLAQASGIHTRAVSYAVLFLVAVVVAVSMRVAGGLLIYALMILPVSAAFQWVYDIKKVFVLAPALGIVASMSGFLLSLGADLPIGSSIALCAAGIFLASTAGSPKRRRAGRPRPPR